MSFPLLATFLAVWTAATLLLSRLRWFRRRTPLETRLLPYAYVSNDDDDWVSDAEVWLQQQ